MMSVYIHYPHAGWQGYFLTIIRNFSLLFSRIALDTILYDSRYNKNLTEYRLNLRDET
jgi:hypothetical protein